MNGLNSGFSKAKEQQAHFERLISKLIKIDSDHQKTYQPLLNEYEHYFNATNKMANIYVTQGTDSGNELATMAQQLQTLVKRFVV